MFPGVHFAGFRTLLGGALGLCAATAASGPGFEARIAGIRAELRTAPQHALANARELVAANPRSAASYLVLGEAHLRLAQLDQAEAALAEASRLDPDLSRAWLSLGRVAEARFERAQALAYYERAYALDPLDSEIQWAARGRARRLSVPWASADPADPELENWRLVSAVGRARIRLERVANPGHLNGWGVNVTFNHGKPIRLLLDTGATGIMLSSDLQERAGLAAIGRGVIRGVGEENGFRPVTYAQAESVRVGPVEYRNALVQIAARQSLVGLDGLIGTDVFAHFIVTLDFQRRELQLDSPELEDNSEYNGYVPVLRQGHALLLPLRVDDGADCLFQIDTGANSSFISSTLDAMAGRLTVEPTFRVRGASGHVARVYRAEQVKIEFAGLRRRIGRLLSIDFSLQNAYRHVNVHGILGLPELSEFRLSIDYGHGRVRLEPVF
jgi:hypothetical protein